MAREFEWERLSDYRERFKYEFEELELRLGRLEEMLVSKDLKLSSPRGWSLLVSQCGIMKEYRDILLKRAEVEGIGVGV